MKVVRILYGFAVVVGFETLHASEYYHAYDVNQPVMGQSKRALEYDRAQNANIRTRATNFYNRLKSALGFQPSVQQRPRINELSKAESAKPEQDIKIEKNENYRVYGTQELLAKAHDKKIGVITFSPSRCWIDTLGVDPEHQKKGIGSKLFKSAVDQMKNCEDIGWWATPDSVPFYRKQGAQKGRGQQTILYQNMILDRTGGRARIKRNFYDRPF